MLPVVVGLFRGYYLVYNSTVASCQLKGSLLVKKMHVFIALAALCLFSTLATANAKYASYSESSAYLSWAGAQSIYASVNSTDTTQTTPHGGYTQTTVKCAVCHSTHRAYTSETQLKVALDDNLLPGNSCLACHASGGSNATTRLIEWGTITAGPHSVVGGTDCNASNCHGSVHGAGASSKYATVRKFNLSNKGSVGALDAAIDAAIVSGNIPKDLNGNPLKTVKSTDGTSVDVLSEKSLDQGMKSYATGYVCYQCHGESSRSVANADFASGNGYKGHLSVGTSVSTYIPTCEGCHDAVGVSTGTTLFPHSDRGVDVYVGRFNQHTQEAVVSANIRTTTNTDATRYGLWMTSANYNDNAHAEPMSGAIANSANDWQIAQGATSSAAQANINNMLVDGACVKCHDTSVLR